LSGLRNFKEIKEQVMELRRAIELFNSYRACPLSSNDVEQITRVAETLGLQEFTVVPSGAYLRDESSIIHVNPGFVVSRLAVDDVDGMEPDDVYAHIGYEYRLWLSGEAKQRKDETMSQRPCCPLCAGLPGDDHLLDECPRLP
jgi:hypothetical protein